MPLVKFPPHLMNRFPVPAECAAEGSTVADVLADLERRYPGLSSYVVDERGAMRQHVNIFVGGAMLRDRATLSDVVEDDTMIHVMQALSGG